MRGEIGAPWLLWHMPIYAFKFVNGSEDEPKFMLINYDEVRTFMRKRQALVNLLILILIKISAIFNVLISNFTLLDEASVIY